MPFPFEKFVLYQKSIIWMREAQTICRLAKHRMPHNLVDQLFRASASIPLNVAEGCGKWMEKDRRNFYRMARGSVFECVPILQIFTTSHIISKAQYEKSYALLEEIGKMLTAIIKKTESIPDR